MSTSFEEIYRVLDGLLTDKQRTSLEIEYKREVYLESVISNFEDYFRYEGYIEEKVDFANKVINDDLTLKEKRYIALEILLEYYRLEKVKWSTIVNLTSGSTKITGIDETKRMLQENYNEVQAKIDKLLSTVYEDYNEN